MSIVKKEISEGLHFPGGLSSDFFAGDIYDVARRITGIPDALKKGNDYVKRNPELFIRYEIQVEFHYDYDEYLLFGIRMETDAELEKRKARLEKAKEAGKKSAEARKAKKEEKEKKLLAELKQKYEQGDKEGN